MRNKLGDFFCLFFIFGSGNYCNCNQGVTLVLVSITPRDAKPGRHDLLKLGIFGWGMGNLGESP